MDPLRAYKNEDIIIQLPGETTVFNVDWLSVYDIATKTNFGSVIIPDSLNVPPSLIKVRFVNCVFFIFAKIERIFTSNKNRFQVTPRSKSLPNCFQLHKDYQVSWEIFGPQITIQLAGLIGLSKIENLLNQVSKTFLNVMLF